MPRLGELLVAGGVITAAQVEQALRAQVMWGARFGTNLIELGFLDLDQLSTALGQQHKLPAALARHFERGEPALQERLPAALAEAYAAIPLFSVPGEGIVVASSSPLAPPTRAKLAEALGVSAASIIPSVAAELRIRYQLERVYKVKRTARFLRAPGKTIPPFPALVIEDADPDSTPDIELLPVASTSTTAIELEIDVDGELTLPSLADPPGPSATHAPSTPPTPRATPPAPVSVPSPLPQRAAPPPVTAPVPSGAPSALPGRSSQPIATAGPAAASSPVAIPPIVGPDRARADAPVAIIPPRPAPPVQPPRASSEGEPEIVIEQPDRDVGPEPGPELSVARPRAATLDELARDNAIPDAALEDTTSGRERRTYARTIADAHTEVESRSLGRIAIRRVAVGGPSPVGPGAAVGSTTSLPEATRAIRRAPGRDLVVEHALDALERFVPTCEAAAILVLRGQIASSWLGFTRSGAVHPEIVVPLDQPGLVERAAREQVPVRASKTDLRPLDQLLLVSLGGRAGDLAAVPILVAGQVMCVLALVTEVGAPLAAAEAVAGAAGAAFARLMRDASR